MINKKRYEILSAKYLTGNCSKDEKLRLEQWLAVSDVNQSWFEQRKLAWKLAGTSKAVKAMETEAALALVHQKISDIAQQQQFLPRQRSITRRVSTWAAGVAAVLVLGLAVIFMLKKDKAVDFKTFVMNEKSSEALQLADGSQVYMNVGSQLQYAADFDEKRFVAGFEGEALFDVQSDPDKPFKILLDHLGVEVLGTSFNLRAIPGSSTYSLDLIHGKVRLFTFDENPEELLEQLILLAGESGVYDTETGRLSRSKTTDNNFMSWKTGVLEFVNAPLPEVIKTLNRVYNINIQLASKHEDLRLTARFEGETADQLIESLQTVFEFELLREGNQVYFN